MCSRCYAHCAAIDKLVICFNLENGINLTHAGVSSKQKLNLYNLTADGSSGKKGYYAIWREVMLGRVGNDITSAFISRLVRQLHAIKSKSGNFICHNVFFVET